MKNEEFFLLQGWEVEILHSELSSSFVHDTEKKFLLSFVRLSAGPAS